MCVCVRARACTCVVPSVRICMCLSPWRHVHVEFRDAQRWPLFDFPFSFYQADLKFFLFYRPFLGKEQWFLKVISKSVVGQLDSIFPQKQCPWEGSSRPACGAACRDTARGHRVIHSNAFFQLLLCPRNTHSLRQKPVQLERESLFP